MELLAVDALEVHPEALAAGGAAAVVDLGDLAAEEAHGEVGPAPRDGADVVLEGSSAGGAVDPADGAVGLVVDDGVEDGGQWGDTGAGRDEDDGHGAVALGVKVEIAGRVSDLYSVAGGVVVNELVRDHARS